MIRLGIRVRAADAEIAFARLEPVLAGGAEEVELGEAVEFAVYGEDVPDARLRALAGDTLIAVTREPVDPGLGPGLARAPRARHGRRAHDPAAVDRRRRHRDRARA